MAELVILYWRDIPAQVIVKRGRRSEKRMLSDRFMQAIDMAAMRAGAHGESDYLDEWRRGDPRPCGDDPAKEAEQAVASLESSYDAERLKALIRNGGRETASQ